MTVFQQLLPKGVHAESPSLYQLVVKLIIFR